MQYGRNGGDDRGERKCVFARFFCVFGGRDGVYHIGKVGACYAYTLYACRSLRKGRGWEGGKSDLLFFSLPLRLERGFSFLFFSCFRARKPDRACAPRRFSEGRERAWISVVVEIFSFLFFL